MEGECQWHRAERQMSILQGITQRQIYVILIKLLNFTGLQLRYCQNTEASTLCTIHNIRLKEPRGFRETVGNVQDKSGAPYHIESKGC